MTIRSRLTRREFSRKLGFTAAGLAVLSSTSLFADTATPRQTEGPFYPDSNPGDTDLDLTRIEGHDASASGEHIYVHGQVMDTAGNPLQNATVDVWQANHVGKYWHSQDPNPAALDPNFQGWGIVQTDNAGFYRFKTIKPAAYSLEAMGGQGSRARHIHYKISHADYAGLTTQLYFPGDSLLEQDEEFNSAPENERWRLVSTEESPHQDGLPIYRFDIVLA